MRIVTRHEWGAAYARPGTPAPKRRAKLYLHHTDRLPKSIGKGRAGVRWVQGYHLGKGWLDVGYPFLYSPTEREVYIGRDAGIVGAHTKGSNVDAHAIAVLGDYHPPTDDHLPEHAVEDLAAFLRWYEAEGYGPARFTGGHRDVVSTGCPGDVLYARIPDINAAARAVAPEPPEDDMTPADLEAIKDLVQAEHATTRDMVTQARDRANEAIRLIQVVAEDAVAAERHASGLAPDLAADAEAIAAIRVGDLDREKVFADLRKQAAR